MCGLAGAFSLDGSPVRHEAIHAMTEALVHRGPDEGAVRLLDAAGDPAPEAARLGLGHRRLRVIDLTSAAAQPMRDPEGRGWLIYNGELYNAADLRRELAGRGVRFRSRSDTEVVLQALVAWGVEALPRFNGMFAIAYWDVVTRRLLLARDRFGEKPLYHATVSGRLVFASELGALLRHGDVPLDLDPQALELYLTFGFIPAPWTIYRAVRKLPHAACLLAREGGDQVVRRYHLIEESLRREAPARPVEAVRRTLAEAVGRRLEADVPLGAFLSGGLDSSAVVAFMRRAGGDPPRTYSMAIPDLPYFDEAARARRTAVCLGTRHSETRVDAARLQGEIPAVLDHFDEPFADSSALASSLIAREARRDLTVALSGDGGDEVFGGYRLFRALAAHDTLRRLPPAAREALRRLLAPLPARHGGGLAGAVRGMRRMLDGLAAALPAAHAGWMSICGPAARRELRPGSPDEDLGRALVEERYRRFAVGPGRSALDSAMAVEVDLPLPDDMLAKLDRTSMRHALEVRAPFLDPALVDLALSLPASAHFSLWRGKRLLRRALAGVVPGHVLRAPKRGFEVPVGHWLTGSLAGFYGEVVSEAALGDLPGLDPGVARRWFAEHRDRRADRGAALWALFALCWWRRGPHREHSVRLRPATARAAR
ncbi:MAG TPA: asparagine synthase (glutamine-hydrolyzing) [Candidatus Polarisedimenticolia bacterium]|nr:asparagine synthase (glutamine-hydrolyzing) [Candidatus Polarisedimenticolia bacterium]